MENQMTLEERLKRQRRNHRIIWWASTWAFLTLMIVFSVLREETKVVDTGGFLYNHVSYNPFYTVARPVCFCLGMHSFVVALFCTFACRIKTLEVGASMVTLYLGLTGAKLFVDGQPVERKGYYIEARLRDGSQMTVSLSRSQLYAHMSFSNGHPPVDC